MIIECKNPFFEAKDFPAKQMHTWKMKLAADQNRFFHFYLRFCLGSVW